MKVVCSWCRKEGKSEFVGEKAPLDDARETHGICLPHRDHIHQRWQASLQKKGAMRILSAASSFALVRWGGLLSLTKKIKT